MRIFAKKAYALGPGAKPHSTEIDQIVTVPMAFMDIPDEYVNDTMFKMAVKSGNITVIESKPIIPVDYKEETEHVEEEIAEEEETEHAEESHDVDPFEEFKNTLNLAKKDEVIKLAEEYGAEFIESDRLKENKKRVYEAYKIKMADAAKESAENIEE